MSKLHHPNSVALHKVCSTMDFYHGGTFCDLVYNHLENIFLDIWSLGIILFTMLLFDVKGGYNNIKELIDLVLAGLTKEHFAKLDQVSMEIQATSTSLT